MRLLLNGEPLALADIHHVCSEKLGNRPKVEIDSAVIPKIEASRRVIEQIAERNLPIYGVTTGFGLLSNVRIEPDQLSALQVNLVRSHACGVGKPLGEPEARALTLLRANVLAKGFSGIRLEVIQRLVDILNHDIYPLIPSQGSVGASGDLAPLAHLAQVVIGEGMVEYKGQKRLSQEVFDELGLPKIELQAKEGLALLNGTQALTGVGSIALTQAYRVLHAANIAGMMTLDALRDTPAAYEPRIHNVRPHSGQVRVAKLLTELIEGSEIRESHRYTDTRVQDAYSLRCMPQVHGAILDVLDHVKGVVEIESGSATDNPLVFADSSSLEDSVISGGNFHGAPLAYAFDYAAIAITDLMSICERRIERLVNPDLSEGLPAFLTKNAGLESGFMIPQVVAAALLNESKVLSHPASVDNVPTSGGKEDHVSMGMVAACKFSRIVQNAAKVIAIELIAAAQGLDFRAPLKTSPRLQIAYNLVRKYCEEITSDRSLSEEFESVANSILEGTFEQI